MEVSTFRAAADRRRRDGRARPAAVRQRLRLAGGGRRAARLHDQRALLRSGDRRVWDYVGGVADIRARRLKLIGAPVTRFREDPVRMLRAVRLAAKLGLDDRAQDARADPQLAPLMRTCRRRVCSTRCRSCCCRDTPRVTLRSLRAHGLSHGLLPLLDVILEQPLGTALHRRRARRHRRARARRQGACRRRSCSRRCCGTRCSCSGTRAKARGERPLPALFDAMDKVLRRAGAKHRHPAPLRSDDEGDLVAAAALRAARRARGRSACSSIRAFARPTISSRCAAKAARRRWRSSTGGRASRMRRTTSARRC